MPIPFPLHSFTHRMERRNFSHSQRMGGINGIVLSKDERFLLSVGQERRLTYWDMTKQEPARLFFLDGESDEGKVLAISYSGRLIATGIQLPIRLITTPCCTLKNNPYSKTYNLTYPISNMHLSTNNILPPTCTYPPITSYHQHAPIHQ